MKKSLIDGIIGFVVSFLTLVPAWFFATWVNASRFTVWYWLLFTVILFALYAVTPFYRKRHERNPRSFWFALLSFLIGGVVTYLCLLLIVTAAVAWMSPAFPG